LPRKIELDGPAFDSHMPWTQRRNSVTSIFVGIDLAPGPQEIHGKYAQDAGEHSLARQPFFA
jgi:hypothetical protein